MNSHPASVGIIANPASGTDIRRIVAMGTVLGTQEKFNIVQRILVGLDAAGVEQFRLRAVAKGCGQTPILPLYTGTNSVIPYFVESMTAGQAAGSVAQQSTKLSKVAERSTKLEVLHEDGT